MRKYGKLVFILVLAMILSMSPMGVVMAGEEDTEASYRMKGLLDKLSAMSSQDIEASASRFSDMGSHWSRSYVGKLAALEIISGYGDGKFGPDDVLLADQFIKMIVTGLGYTPEQGEGYWAQPYIDIAIKEGIVLEGEINDYKKPLTREQMAVIIVRATLLVEANPGNKYDEYIIGKVSDYAEVSDKMKQYVIDAFKLGLVTGVPGGKFKPKDNLTRAEAAAVVLRFLDKKERKPMAPGPDEILVMYDNGGNLAEYYPGPIREYFDVAKAMIEAVPKAKGYVCLFNNSENGIISASFYEDEDAYKKGFFNMIGGFEIYTGLDIHRYTVYNLTVFDDEKYKELFKDYMYEVFKTLYGPDVDKAITLHDKYMNMEVELLQRKWEVTRLNNRDIGIFREKNWSFVMQSSVMGVDLNLK